MKIHTASLALLLVACAAPIMRLSLGASVKLTDGDCNMYEFDDVPCCSGWGLSPTTECEDDCFLAIAFNTTVPPIDITVRVDDGMGNTIGQITNSTGVYLLEGLALGNYRVSIASAAAGHTIGSFVVRQTTSVSFRLGVQTMPTCSACDSIDFNNDGVSPDSLDILDFISVFAGGACSNDPNCNGIDFNNDGVAPDSLDIDALLIAFGGGACP